jgi:hypothetical protein
MFKTLKLLREDRERLWTNYSNICESVKHEMESKREEAKSNASTIEHEIEGHFKEPTLTKSYMNRMQCYNSENMQDSQR